jgi:hypothetical protein
MLTRILVSIILSCVLFGVDGKVYTVCELVEELYNDHSIPHSDIYKHLCIIGSLMHTNKSHNDFLGLYRIGSEW